MRKIYSRQLKQNLKYFRKIHIYRGIYLVSLYARRTHQGDFSLNLHNILRYPLTYILFPIKVIDWNDTA